MTAAGFTLMPTDGPRAVKVVHYLPRSPGATASDWRSVAVVACRPKRPGRTTSDLAAVTCPKCRIAAGAPR